MNRLQKGFTLIELLVVIAILAIMLAISIVAINPREQLSRANDYSAKALTLDFIKSSIEYYTTSHAFPWVKNSDCATQVAAGGTLDQMPDCVTELAKGGKLEEQYNEAPQLKEIYASKCGNTVVFCYNPKSKIENTDGEANYDKFGVNNPGCPGHASTRDDCYWCKPAFQTADCQLQPSLTPTLTPTMTLTPTNTPTPTPNPIPQVLSGYANDAPKFFKTYAVYFFEYPGFPPPPGGWSTHLSLNADFSGDYTQTNKSFGIPSQYGPEGPSNASYTAYRKITMKYVGFASTPSNTGVYSLSNCGKTLYYRIANYYNDSATDKKVGPTYTATFDCTTKVGVVDPPLSWYTVYDQFNGVQKQYDATWDFDRSGAIDWVDYWLVAFSTKSRYGGWQPPE